MKQLIAFMKKEYMEIMRSGKFMILSILFIFLGIMNPAMAKITPWMMEVASESLSEAGLEVTKVNVDALTSWTQYYKNMPIAIIVFLIMFSGILTTEYQKGTLINMVTKGLVRWKIIISKTMMALGVWTILYWLSFLITYGYNEYFLDNSIAKNVFFGAFCIYIMGVWLISLLLLAQTVTSTNISAVLFTGCVFFGFYIIGMLTKIK